MSVEMHTRLKAVRVTRVKRNNRLKREHEIENLAYQKGLIVMKCPSTDTNFPCYNTYMLYDIWAHELFAYGPDGYGLTLDEIEQAIQDCPHVQNLVSDYSPHLQ